MLAAASLELKAEKQNAHAQKYGESIKAVQFSPDGSTIVSCGVDQTLKVWGAGACTLTPSIRTTRNCGHVRGRLGDDTKFTVDLRVNDTGEIIGENAHGDEFTVELKLGDDGEVAGFSLQKKRRTE